MQPREEFIQIRNLKKWFPVTSSTFLPPSAYVKAVDDVSLTIRRGEVLAVVGESGSGKSTLGRLVLQLQRPTSGNVIFDGARLESLSSKEMRAFRRRMQIVFQDPFSSLNPHMRVGDALAEVLTVHRIGQSEQERRERVRQLLDRVGLRASSAERFPHEFSGGQRQRIGIARAVAAEPEFIVADEPVSALDVSIQAQVLNLLQDLQDVMGLTMLFISHDLAVVRHISDRVAVMYLGRIMEIAPKDQLFDNPQHPYTQALLSAVPDPDRGIGHDRVVLKGDIPSPISPPSGCVFRTRCPYAVSACADVRPDLRVIGVEHQKASIRDDTPKLSS
jgi:oligopeptide/dipeptide ABC transporter ATP-binding protein